jgi:hypothetical protein
MGNKKAKKKPWEKPADHLEKVWDLLRMWR